jgi:DNA-directed RNA polymerase specialized sigma24 family protein
MIEYSNSEITKIINEYIHNERNRKLLLRRYVDGITLESLAEEFELSVRQVKNIIYNNEDVILKHLKTD